MCADNFQLSNEGRCVRCESRERLPKAVPSNTPAFFGTASQSWCFRVPTNPTIPSANTSHKNEALSIDANPSGRCRSSFELIRRSVRFAESANGGCASRWYTPETQVAPGRNLHGRLGNGDDHNRAIVWSDLLAARVRLGNGQVRGGGHPKETQGVSSVDLDSWLLWSAGQGNDREIRKGFGKEFTAATAVGHDVWLKSLL